MKRTLLLALALSLAPASTALAQREIAVPEFAGPRGSVVRQQVVLALERAGGLTVVGAETPGARATVEGRVGRVGRRWRARLRVVSSDGRELASETLGARQVGSLTARVREWARGSLASLVSSLEAAPVPSAAPEPAAAIAVEEVPTRSARPDAPAPPPEAAPARLRPPLSVSVGMSVVNRSFTYNDDIFGALVPYSLPAAPMVHASAEWFPGGHVDLGVLSGLSVRAEGEGAVGLESVGSDGEIFGTDLWSVAIGLRYRLRIDDFELRADGGYRVHAFTVHEPAETQRPPDLPNVEIHAIRAGGGFRWDAGLGVFFFGHGAYLAPLAVGEIASEAWFPRASAGGVEGDVGMGLRIDDVELRGLFTMRRFFYDMRSEPGDARVAGGAVDQYMSGVLELAWTPSQLAQ